MNREKQFCQCRTIVIIAFNAALTELHRLIIITPIHKGMKNAFFVLFISERKGCKPKARTGRKKTARQNDILQALCEII